MPQNKARQIKFGLFATTIMFSLASGAALAADAAKGKALYEKNCLGCHDDSVYKRADRRIESKEALTKQITGCQHAANAKLSKGQINDLAQYLNSTYYKFK